MGKQGRKYYWLELSNTWCGRSEQSERWRQSLASTSLQVEMHSHFHQRGSGDGERVVIVEHMVRFSDIIITCPSSHHPREKVPELCAHPDWSGWKIFCEAVCSGDL